MLESLEKVRISMSKVEAEDMRDTFVEDKIQRRILELLEKGISDQEIVDILIEEMNQ